MKPSTDCLVSTPALLGPPKSASLQQLDRVIRSAMVLPLAFDEHRWRRGSDQLVDDIVRSSSTTLNTRY